MEDLAEDWGLTKVDSLPNQVGVLLLGVWECSREGHTFNFMVLRAENNRFTYENSRTGENQEVFTYFFLTYYNIQHLCDLQSHRQGCDMGFQHDIFSHHRDTLGPMCPTHQEREILKTILTETAEVLLRRHEIVHGEACSKTFTRRFRPCGNEGANLASMYFREAELPEKQVRKKRLVL